MTNVFAGCLASSEIADVYSDSAIVQAMLDFQAGLARAKAAVGVLPASAASTIVRSCKAEIFDITSAMPHKRNQVAALIGITAAGRVPQRVACLLAAMPQKNERGLGTRQAELAEWPELVVSVHGSTHAMALALGSSRSNRSRNALRCAPARSCSPWSVPAPKARPPHLRVTRGCNRISRSGQLRREENPSAGANT